MTARGIRNNNPGNIRLGGGWAGLAENQSDEIFCVFADMQHGIRALIKLLMAYWRRYGLNSVISRYAPSSENNTIAYENAVAAALGVKPHQKIDLSDPQVLFTLAKAIARHECGADAALITEEQWLGGPPRRVGGLIYAHMKKRSLRCLTYAQSI